MQKEIVWHTTEAIAAPFIPISGIGINIMFKINFIITPHPNPIIGTISFPIPCKAPFKVCSSIVNKIVNELICSTVTPDAAFGNSSFNIGSAKTIIPIVHGSPIKIVSNIE